MENTNEPNELQAHAGEALDASARRKRPAPGERRIQILQMLATMLEAPRSERVTTAVLAKELQVSEAALYRHFASKAQMFEGLIAFIESSVFGLMNQIAAREPEGASQCAQIAMMVLQFGEKNKGMARVMVGDALVFENDRLIERMGQFFDKIESHFKQVLRTSFQNSATPTVEAQTRASTLTAFLAGRLQRFARSGFRKMPTEQMDAAIALILR